MGAEIGVMIALTALSTATSVAAAGQANKQQRAIADYQNRQKELAFRKSVAFNKATGQIKAAEEKRVLQLKYDLMKGASTASAAERGTLESNTQASILNSLGYQAARESAKITMEQNLADLGYSINAQPQWSVAGSQSTFLAGIQGGLQGLQLGLSVAGGMNDLNTANQIQGIGGGGGGAATTIPEVPNPVTGGAFGGSGPGS